MELIILGPLLLSVALITLAERKIMGTIQRRIGPNRVGVIGILQPIVDGLKLVLKETIIIGKSNKYIFMIVPMINLIMSLIGFSIIGIGGVGSVSVPNSAIGWEIKNEVIIEQKNSIMILLLISSVGIITIILAGWSGNSKYAIIGSLRTTAQMISYEISIGLIIISIIIIIDSINIKIMIENQISKGIRLWNIISIWPIGIIMIISSIAETNRAPMDLPEAESELVSGFMTEHSSFAFACFFLAEYSNIILMCILISDILLGASIISVGIIIYIFIWVRSSVPRLRYDQLMSLMWKGILPLLLGSLSIEMCILTSLA